LAYSKDATVKTGLRRCRRTLAALFLFGAIVAPAAGAEPVTAERHMVLAANPLAAEAGREGVALGD
jgi:hypothetical protein